MEKSKTLELIFDELTGGAVPLIAADRISTTPIGTMSLEVGIFLLLFLCNGIANRRLDPCQRRKVHLILPENLLLLFIYFSVNIAFM